jgi:hypothetical protein
VGSTTIVEITMSNAGHYVVTLSGPLDTPNGGAGENGGNDVFSVGVSASDQYGNTATAGTLTINVEDDAPPAFTPASLTGVNEIGNTVGDHGTGSLNFVAGADGVSSTVIDAALVSSNATAHGHNLVLNPTATSVAGGVTTFTVYEDANNNGVWDAGDTTQVGTLAINPGANSYTFTLTEALDPTLTSEGIGSAATSGSGPHPDIILNGTGGSGIAAGPVVDIYAFHYATSFDPTVGHWTGTGAITNDQINSSTSGLGVNSNNFTNPELIHFDFGAYGDTNNPSFDTQVPPPPMVHSVDMTFPHYTSGDVVDYKIVYEDQTGHVLGSLISSLTGTSLTNGFTFAAPTGEFIQSIELFDASGKGKIQLGNITTVASMTDDTLTFTTTLSDKDGDHQTSGQFSVEVNSTHAPVVLDLTGQGVSFVGESAGVTFDYGDGQGEVQTAWAAPGEGVLALLTSAGAVVSFTGFVQGATTDLQGLAAFDSNHDGKLDAGDALFSNFGAIVNGHYESLTQLGITSIDLTTDGHAYSAANGQVMVNGTGSFTYANGATGAAADAAFTTGAQVASVVNDALSGGQAGPDLNQVIDALKGGQPAGAAGQAVNAAGQSYLDLHTGASDAVNTALQQHPLVAHDAVSGTHHA